MTEKLEKDNRWTFDRLWQEYKSRKPYSKSLSIDDSRYNKYIQPLFGYKTIREISQFEIDKLRINLLKKKKPQTVKHVLAQIVRISNFAGKKNLCEDISFHIEMPRVNNIKTEDLSPTQLQTLLDAIELEKDNPAADMMKIALFRVCAGVKFLNSNGKMLIFKEVLFISETQLIMKGQKVEKTR